MPEEQAGNAAGAQGEDTWEKKLWSIGKSIAIFLAIQYAMRQFIGGGNQSKTPATPDTSAGSKIPADAAQQPLDLGPETVYPMWPVDTNVDISMFISSDMYPQPFSTTKSKAKMVLDAKDFPLDMSKKDNRELHTSFSVPKSVQSGGTLWAHIFVGKHGAVLDPSNPMYDPEVAYQIVRPLTQRLPKKKVRKTRNLLEAQNETDIEEDVPKPGAPSFANYYHPNFTLSFVADAGNSPWPSLHPAMKQYYTLFEGPGPQDQKSKYYYPILYLNTFWQLRSQMIELNNTSPVGHLDMNIQLSTLRNWQFSIMSSMDEGMKETARKVANGETTPGGGDGSELELVKETLLDTNPWLLGTTAIVSVLHMIFELLAFSSDVGHWRKKKDNVGVSVRTILSNVVMQSIIFLYLMDNNENTSWMILFGQGIGIAIEAWKITKTVDVRVREPQPGSWAHGLLPYLIVFEDKHQLSETEEKTEEYDKIAFKYMGIVAVPLLLAYAAYSLKYETHKSWYSFIIATLVGSVYAYGFLMMVPSLYINYRLKSVAHMPAKAMMYKFLNTFIDDLFAFTIKMPTLHRLATLRDDVIFFVYLYQAWAYKVDYTRINEFGQGGDDEEVDDKKATKPLQAPAGGETNAIKQIDHVAKSTGAKNEGSAKKRK